MIKFIGNISSAVPSSFTLGTVEECLGYFKDKEVISIDTETQGRNPHSKKILALQIGDSENQYVIDCRSVDILKFKGLLESKLCIGHNIKFDYKFLKHVGIDLKRVYDTMLAECVIYCGYEKFGYSLKDLVKRYLNIELDKETRGDFYKLESQPFTDKQIEYAGLDVAYLHKIRELQLEKINTYNLEYCVNLENEVLKALGDIEYNGMGFNPQAWIKNAENHESELIKIENKLDQVILNDKRTSKYKLEYIQGDLFGQDVRQVDINYNSPKQILEVSQALGFILESSSDRELKKLVKRDVSGNVISSQHKFFELLQDYRKCNKIVTTYGKSFLKSVNKTTQRVHTDFWQIQATGRVSSGNKESNAPNIQNIPASNAFRNCFIARPGFKWISIDYSSQELSIMADLSQEKVFIEALSNKQDLHSICATLLFKKPITKKDKERNAAKTLVFGLSYGMGPQKLADQLSITLEEAKELIKMFNETFPTVTNWLKQAGRNAKKNKKSVTQDLCKRIRWYPKLRTSEQLKAMLEETESEDPEVLKEIRKIEGEVEREGKNHLIQGCGANVTKEALVYIRNLILEYNKKYNSEVAYLICTVHDQIDCEVREDLAEEFAVKMEELMLKAANKYITKVKSYVETTKTTVWQK